MDFSRQACRTICPARLCPIRPSPGWRIPLTLITRLFAVSSKATLYRAMSDWEMACTGTDDSPSQSMLSLPTNASWSEASETGQSSIAPGSPSTIESGEFEPSDFEPSDFDDSESLDDSTSVGSSVYGHSYQHGRRYHKARNIRQNRHDCGVEFASDFDCTGLVPTWKVPYTKR